MSSLQNLINQLARQNKQIREHQLRLRKKSPRFIQHQLNYHLFQSDLTRGNYGTR